MAVLINAWLSVISCALNKKIKTNSSCWKHRSHHWTTDTNNACLCSCSTYKSI